MQSTDSSFRSNRDALTMQAIDDLYLAIVLHVRHMTFDIVVQPCGAYPVEDVIGMVPIPRS